MSATKPFRDAYLEAFVAYLDDAGEGALQSAYELGREAIAGNLSVLELSEAHHHALRATTRQADRDLSSVIEAGATFFAESLSTFEMTQRGFFEARRIAEIEQAHSEQLRQLADALVEVNSAVHARDLASGIVQKARSILDVDTAEVTVTADVGSVAHARAGGDPDPTAPSLTARLSARDGRELGTLYVSGPHDGRFGDADEAILVQLAQMASLALEKAQLYEKERQTAETLQRTLLPARLPDIHGVAVCSRYQPGSAGAEVGGDWYDLIRLPDDRIALVVGDVTGRGVQAASVMGQLRTALRAYVIEGHGPGSALPTLTRLMLDLDEAFMATVLMLVLDPATRALRLASAGHPPPLLVPAEGEPSFLEGGLLPPAGVAPDLYVDELEMELPERSALLAYTDGLIETRDAPLDHGMARLAEVAGANRDLRPDEFCDRVMTEMIGDGKPDDVALLFLRLEPDVPGS